MIATDFHLHTNLSVDSPTDVDDMVRQAVALGLTHIAFTDHDDHNPADEGAGLYDPARAYEMTQTMRQKFGNQIHIAHGAELGEPHLYTKENETFYRLPLDVVIGSVHCVGLYGTHSDLFDHKGPAEGITEFFDLTLDMTRSADMDIIGHLDYFDRYTSIRNIPPYNPADYRPVITAILETIKARSIALEINTSGYRSNNPRPFPHPQVIEWYYQMGGRLISIASDAHRPEHIAFGYQATETVLRQIGFLEYHIFLNRKPTAIPIK